jgi:hypothetical protein
MKEKSRQTPLGMTASRPGGGVDGAQVAKHVYRAWHPLRKANPTAASLRCDADCVWAQSEDTKKIFTPGGGLAQVPVGVKKNRLR